MQEQKQKIDLKKTNIFDYFDFQNLPNEHINLGGFRNSQQGKSNKFQLIENLLEFPTRM